MAGDPLGNPVGNARRDRLAALIDTQRPHLALWVPVFFALGIAFYFALPGTPTPATRALLRAAADLMAAMAEREHLRTRLRRAEAALEEQRIAPPPRREPAEDSEATGG